MAKSKKTAKGKEKGWGNSAPGRRGAAKAAKPAKGAKGKAVKPIVATTKTSPRPRVRAQPLPGMEQVRDAVLDGICEGIGDDLDQINSATQDLGSLRDAGRHHMEKTGQSYYRHSGVGITLVPGAGAKLRVKRVKDDESNVSVSDSGGPRESASTEHIGDVGGDTDVEDVTTH